MILSTRNYVFSLANIVSRLNTYKKSVVVLNEMIAPNFTLSISQSTFTNDTFTRIPCMSFKGVIQLIRINNVNVTNSTGNIYEFTPIQADFRQISEISKIFKCLLGDSTYQQIQADHVISIFNAAQLTLTRIDFKFCSSFQNGASIFAGYKNVNVILLDCAFENNFAVFGGTIYSEYGNEISCIKCGFYNNTAVLGGAVYLLHDSSMILTNAIFDKNWAMLYPIMYLGYAKNSISSCSLCDINSNIIPTDARVQLRTKLTGYSTLQGLVDTYSVKQNDKAAIKLENGYLKFNITKTISQSYFISAISDSILYINNLEYFVPSEISTIVNVEASFLSITNTDFKTLQLVGGSNISPENIPFLFEVLAGSSFALSQTNFSSIGIPILKCQRSKMNIESVIIGSITQSGTNMIITRNCDTTITDVNITNALISNIPNLLYIQQNSVLSLVNSRFTNFNGGLIGLGDSTLNIKNSTITASTLVGGNKPESGRAVEAEGSNIVIENSTLSYLDSSVNGGAISLTQSLSKRKNNPNYLTITSSNFTNNVSALRGGSIFAENVDVTIENSILKSSSSQDGGAIYLSCDVNADPGCSYKLSSVQATQNTASKYGGALYTDMFKPNITNSIFEGNTASTYGTDYAAYPLEIKINSGDLISVVSGQTVGDILSYVAYDFFDQVAFNLGNKLSSLQINSSDISLREQSRASSNNGEFIFTNTIIVGLPGTNGTLTFLTSALDLDKYNRIYGTNASQIVIDSPFAIRYCDRGEAQENNICVKCAQGTYTLEANSSRCLNCPSNAHCPGEDVIQVDKGYWRASVNTDVIYECLCVSGCLGGQESTCRAGYYGRLCNECVFNETMKYSRSKVYDCAECPSNTINMIYFAMYMLGTSCYVAFLTYNNYINAIKEKDSTVLVRIFTMYMQIYGIIASFDATSGLIYSMVSFVSIGGESSGRALVSLDCIFLEQGISQDTLYIMKLLIISVFPIIGGLMAGAFYGIFWCISKKYRHIMGRLYIVTLCAIYYLMYPTIVNFTVNLINCVNIEGDNWLKQNTNIQCWTGRHIFWIIFVGVPIFIIWIFGVPITILLTLRRREKYLDEEKNLRTLGFWYIGLKRKTHETEDNHYEKNAYYWEFLMEFRKTLLITINSIGSAIHLRHRALLMLIVLYLTCVLVSKIKPYRKEYLNKVHYIADFVALVTFGIAVEIEDSGSDTKIIVLFCLMIALNIAFIGLFIFYYVSYNIKDRIERIKKATEEREYKKMLEDIKREEMLRNRLADDDEDYNIVYKRRKHLKKSENLYKYQNADIDLAKNYKSKFAKEEDKKNHDVSRSETSIPFY
ncbi:unnamed protein product [Moneuplotes crassus]|uniref:Uncharacterized protein n=1 Tax=Euplotes crassus TaxID=5936 RepID=A0AAD1Y1U5_EUPCR|nr:unnamed protein product [Moneuplotes crassus]